MRLIDADALLERMKKAMESGSNLNGTFHLYIEHAPTITRPTEKWIPVSERLPVKGKQVLCCNKNGSVFTSAITYLNSNGMVAFGQHHGVIAWMPLPEPYREDGEE